MKTILNVVIICIMVVSCKKHETTSTVYPLSRVLSDSVAIHFGGVPTLPISVSNLVEITIPSSSDIIIASDLVDNYRYIPLETIDNCLISEISKLETDSSFIFILDARNNTVFSFSEKGEFIAQIGKKGRGPEEYIYVYDLAVNRQNKELCLFDISGNKLMYYDYVGNHIRTTPLYYYYKNIAFIKGDMVLSMGYMANTLPEIQGYNLVMAKSTQEPILKCFPFSEMNPYFATESGHSLSTFGNSVYFQEVLSDTIWEITPSQSNARYTFHTASGKIFDDCNRAELTDILYNEITKGKTYYSGYFAQTDEYAYFLIISPSMIAPIFYSCKSGQIKYGICMAGRKDPCLAYKFMLFSAYVIDNSFVSIIQPTDILDASRRLREDGIELNAKDQQLLDNLSEEDNPVLMLVKLKDF